MNHIVTPVCLDKDLIKVLSHHGIEPLDYGPAYGVSAGLDLFNVGPDIEIQPTKASESSEWPKFYDKQLYKILIDTGLRLALPSGWAGFVEERGSITKTPLKVRAGIIDPGYTGRVFINCVNLDTQPWLIRHGEKLPFQLVVKPFASFTTISTEMYESLTKDSTRGEGKIGSSDQ